jgi:cystathionine beta-lyase
MAYQFDKIIDRQTSHSVKYDMLEEKFGRKDLIPLWVADMDFETPDFIIQGIQKRLEHPVIGYSIKPQEYYQTIQDWLWQKHQWKPAHEAIIGIGGVVPALALAVLAFSEPKDKIIVQPPVYFPFFESILRNDRQLVENPLKLVNGRYEMDFDDLIAKIDEHTKMLMFCSPHNPVGRVWTKAELEKLAQICIENKIIILSDEIHSDLIFKAHKHIPMAAISPQAAAITITTLAPTKTFNVAGMISSMVIAENEQIRHKFLQKQADLHLFVDNVLGTTGLIAAYKNGHQWVTELMDYIECNYKIVESFLEKELPNIKLTKPEGTYLLWLDFNQCGMNDQQLQDFLVNKARLALNPGIWFGEQGSGFARMNIALPAEILKKALVLLKTAFDNKNSD